MATAFTKRLARLEGGANGGRLHVFRLGGDYEPAESVLGDILTAQRVRWRPSDTFVLIRSFREAPDGPPPVPTYSYSI